MITNHVPALNSARPDAHDAGHRLQRVTTDLRHVRASDQGVQRSSRVNLQWARSRRSPRTIIETTVVPAARPSNSRIMPTPYKPVSSVEAAVAVQAAVNATVIAGAATNHRT